ncbi:LETM1 domain-containing protein 1-like [Penaeus indicus]|uniref:LETM1 domain-containing protein 1-like n=1 Tax=Penaeus indicus TaxID=29960 RepID=UPI00300D73DC
MAALNPCLFYRFPLRYRDQIWKMHTQHCPCVFRGVLWRGIHHGPHIQGSARQKYGRYRVPDNQSVCPPSQSSSYTCSSYFWHRVRMRRSALCVPYQSLHWQTETKLLSVRDISTTRVKNMSASPDSKKKQEATSDKESVVGAEPSQSENQDSVKAEDMQMIKTSQKQVKKVGSQNISSKILRYFLDRYTWYLNRFHQSLENEMPDTFNMFRIFSVGLKQFLIDFKDFMMVLVYLSIPGSTLRNCTRRELELYYNMPRDMIRVFPIIALSSLPLGQNLAFPIGYWFPRQLLCHHFWDIKQRHEFALMDMKKRLFNYRPVFRSLQAGLNTIEDKNMREKCRAAFYKLGSGIHPTVREIVELLPLFQGAPFHIKKMYSVHLVSFGCKGVGVRGGKKLAIFREGLLRLHGRSVYFLKRKRLEDYARQLHYLDSAISREGIDSLSHEQLKHCLFMRGLNAANMSTEAMTEYLRNWLRVSREIDSSSFSLLLHLPILLAYNQPTNIVLIY